MGFLAEKRSLSGAEKYDLSCGLYTSTGLGNRASAGTNLCLYDLEKKQPKGSYVGHSHPVYACAIAPDSYSFISGDQIGAVLKRDRSCPSQSF